MKKSQAAVSSPALGYTSPPVSPTITHLSSRNPSPSPPDPHDFAPQVPSSSATPPPPRLPVQRQPPAPNMGSRDEDGAPQLPDGSQRPHRPAMATSASAPVGRLPRLLPYDPSVYIDASLPLSVLSNTTTSLSELSHLIRQQQYKEHQRSQSRVRLHRRLVSAALSSRLLHCGALAYRTLIENFRNNDVENLRSFARLFNAMHDVRASCDATYRYAMLESEFESEKLHIPRAFESSSRFSTFMHEIPQSVRNELLAFIDEIRNNPDFLATRLAGLTQQELAALTLFRPPLDPREAVMATGKGAPPLKKPTLTATPSPIERLLYFHRRDPLSALIHTVFANSSGPDSAEDLRRTDTWATTCARLITEGKPGSEPVIRSILDAWAGMRDWPAKSNFELYLMNVLQDGQFLLDRWENHASRPLTMVAQMTDKELEYATEEFFDRCVKKLFDVIDDEPSAGGLPDGVVEIGTAIIKKLSGPSKKFARAAETVIIHRWFFTTFLRNALIWPESHGLMVGYHISQRARETILKEIAFRAQRQANGMELELTFRQRQQPVNELNQPQIPVVFPEVKAHMENMVAGFRHPRANGRPVLQPAKAVTSPRETVEVHPFLVICPSDIVTLVNALFPDRRPPSGHFSLQSKGLASGASSVSGISITLRNPTSTPGDGSSILSASASSLTSETTSKEPLLDALEKEKELEPRLAVLDDEQVMVSCAPTEEYGRTLRMACAEMVRRLGTDSTSGSCHPCAERWAVLYVGPDGKGLGTRMRKDIEDDDEFDDDSPDSDSEDEGHGRHMDLGSDYHQLKESIVKLLQEYEVPKDLAPESESKGFSNKIPGRQVTKRSTRKQDPDALAEEPSSKPLPLTHGNIAALHASQKAAVAARQRLRQQGRSNSAGAIDDHQKDKLPGLIVMLEAAYHQCSSRDQWVDANRWHRTLEQLRKLSSSSLARNGFAALLNFFARGPRESVEKAFSACDEFEAWFAWLRQSQDRYNANVSDMMLSFKNLRDKMWYKSAVITSAAYEESKNVAMALKMMAQPAKTTDGRPIVSQRGRNPSKLQGNNFLLKSESQVLELMAANPDLAGPNKLSNEQAELTAAWIRRCHIENFCKGEERIHRLCFEIEKCVNKLVGNGVLESPVLWGSDLYYRDRDILDGGRQRGDLFLTGVGMLSIPSDEEYETQQVMSIRSLDLIQRPVGPSPQRPIASRGSQQSFESSTWNSSARSINLMDAPHDYFGSHNSSISIDSSLTFWSPFQAQASSPSGTANIRPSTSSSSHSTVMLKNSNSVNEDKRRFLLDLKQTLTGLLVSDFGNVVFSKGSETDVWFSSDLGEECAARKEAADLRRKQKLARKKSMRALKSARTNGSAGSVPGPDGVSAAEHSSSSETTARSAGRSAAEKAGLLEFPYNIAFRRLLKRFATHPNPFSKLHALYELELLIVSSLTARSGRSYSSREILPTVPQSPTLGSVPEFASRAAAVPTHQAQNMQDTIDNVKDRRIYSITQQQPPSPPAELSTSFHPTQQGAHTPPPANLPPSTEMIVEILQSLFLDANIRPKTLFRDLQYIAALVPASMLDRTPRGKAFWDAGLAALGLKADFVRVLVELADDIIRGETEKRPQTRDRGSTAGRDALTHSEAPTATNPPPGASGLITADPPLATPATDPPKYTMRDAARILLTTAREGDPAAERELAIFYLTHPDLLPRSIAPLSKPKEIFTGEAAHLAASAKQGGEKREVRPGGRGDAVTMCISHHWMECAKRGGDEVAEKYLRARDDMERV